jgi:hypothetical protein
MKLLKTGAFIALLTVCYMQSAAQGSAPPVNEPDYNKPKLFSDLSDNLQLRLADMEALLNLPEGTQVSSTIAPGFTLVGNVVSKSNPADASVKSIVIKSTTRQGATLTFTRIKNEDGSFSYSGRMISKTAGDALVIVKEGANYVIRKKGYYEIINE